MTAPPKKIIEVVLCDKSPLVLSGLVQLFDADPRFDVMATAADGERFMEAVEKIPFDVGIIGWVMPFMNGKDVLAGLRERGADSRIVVYTGDTSNATPRQAMLEGAAGYCAKSEPPERLIDTVCSVAAGRMVFPFMDMRAAMADPLESLSVREGELLRALADGMTNGEIAGKLGISINTVKFHLKNLYEKLDVRNRAQAVSRYLHGPA
jgi:two-component system, NarL family, nitrate/nitrite response regulator NarL